MVLYHSTPARNLARIREQGLCVAMADPASKIRGVWVATSSNRAWAVLHAIRKHKASLEEVVVLEVHVPRATLTRFRAGLYYSLSDIGPEHIGIAIPGTAFGGEVAEDGQVYDREEL